MSEYEAVSPKAKKFFESRNIGPAADLVKTVQKDAGKLFDTIESMTSTDPEVGRLTALAKTHLEIASMFATKAVSRLVPSSS
jgi:hypothetical protein